MAEGNNAQIGDTFEVFFCGAQRILWPDRSSLLSWVSETHGVQADLNKHALIKWLKRCEEPQQQLLWATAPVTKSEFLQQLQPSVLSAYSARSAICAKGIFGPTGTIKHIFPETLIFLLKQKDGDSLLAGWVQKNWYLRNPRCSSMRDFYF